MSRSSRKYRLMGVCLWGIALGAGLAQAAETTVISVSSSGQLGNNDSGYPAVSADGRFVAFQSYADNLVADDTPYSQDIFVRDRATRRTWCVSRATDGTKGNKSSAYPSLSADGRFVAFASSADNLVAGDRNQASDVFVGDLATGQTERVSLGRHGAEADGASDTPSLSADGRFVAFVSAASNLVPGDGNGQGDVFVSDRLTGATERVSVASDDREADGSSFGPVISADGRWVAFSSSAANLVPGDANGETDGFVHDRATGRTERISVAWDGTQGTMASYATAISADGRSVAFHSYAENFHFTALPAVSPNEPIGEVEYSINGFVHDRLSGRTVPIALASNGTPGNGESWSPSLSADGRFVAFASNADNLVPRDRNDRFDLFRHDQSGGGTVRVSVTPAGAERGWPRTRFDSTAAHSGLSGDGRYVAFESDVSGFVPGDSVDFSGDVFMRDTGLDTSRRADLVASLAITPRLAGKNRPLLLSVTVSNRGPAAASGVLLDHILPSAFSLESVQASQGTCSLAHVVVCRLGKLLAGRRATVLVMAVPGRAGRFTSTVSAGALPRDPSPLDNRVQGEIAVAD